MTFTGRHPRALSALIVPLTLVACSIGAASASAAPAPPLPASVTSPGSDPNAVSVITQSQHERDETQSYWTPERLRAADTRGGVLQDADGVSAQLNSTVVPITETNSLGVLFGRKDGHPWRCSANAVDARNLSVVSTAGHCVAERGHTIDHLVFAAGYRGPTLTPLFGTFDVLWSVAPNGWTLQHGDGFDTAFVKVGTRKEAHTDGSTHPGHPVLGQSGPTVSGVAFSATPTGHADAYGYPGAIQSGNVPVRCSDDIQTLDPSVGPHLRVMDGCENFNGGASGGPVVQNINGHRRVTGTVEGYIPSTHEVRVTYWETAARNSWEYAQIH
ncbi:trypsin-like serine peptidase [Clavibacter michiganensis]|uniref:trypsin-like serine peptidase n=1 Tax=Clavibacter michiganensis TaxID=28447 RepID=UPI000A4FFDDE|nr:serine protease [Clavibacter michiganensis]